MSEKFSRLNNSETVFSSFLPSLSFLLQNEKTTSFLLPLAQKHFSILTLIWIHQPFLLFRSFCHICSPVSLHFEVCTWLVVETLCLWLLEQRVTFHTDDPMGTHKMASQMHKTGFKTRWRWHKTTFTYKILSHIHTHTDTYTRTHINSYTR